MVRISKLLLSVFKDKEDLNILQKIIPSILFINKISFFITAKGAEPATDRSVAGYTESAE